MLISCSTSGLILALHQWQLWSTFWFLVQKPNLLFPCWHELKYLYVLAQFNTKRHVLSIYRAYLITPQPRYTSWCEGQKFSLQRLSDTVLHTNLNDLILHPPLSFLSVNVLLTSLEKFVMPPLHTGHVTFPSQHGSNIRKNSNSFNSFKISNFHPRLCHHCVDSVCR